MPQDNWKTIFENQVKLREELIEHIKKEETNLKFNRPYLIVSDIASQFYSEAQLELDYIFGKIETEEQKEGTKLHERMAEEAVVVKFKELIKNIPQAEQIVIMETTFLMKLHDEIIVGKPDVIIFKRGIPIFLFEYKFSKYTTTFPNQQVQAQIYCQILKELVNRSVKCPKRCCASNIAFAIRISFGVYLSVFGFIRSYSLLVCKSFSAFVNLAISSSALVFSLL